MVCPLTYEDGTSRSVYLPEGSWYDFFTGERTEGGRRVEVHAEYDKIPVFVKRRRHHSAGETGDPCGEGYGIRHHSKDIRGSGWQLCTV